MYICKNYIHTEINNYKNMFLNLQKQTQTNIVK